MVDKISLYKSRSFYTTWHYKIWEQRNTFYHKDSLKATIAVTPDSSLKHMTNQNELVSFNRKNE